MKKWGCLACGDGGCLRKKAEAEVFTLNGKLGGELGGLRGAFDEFKEGVLNEISDLRSDLKVLGSELDRSFRWTIGIMLTVLIPMWVTMVVAILLRA